MTKNYRDEFQIVFSILNACSQSTCNISLICVKSGLSNYAIRHRMKKLIKVGYIIEKNGESDLRQQNRKRYQTTATGITFMECIRNYVESN